MVQLQKYFNLTQRGGSSLDNRHLPLLNSLFIDRFSQINPFRKDTDFKTYMKWVRKSPQMVAFLNVIATDMLSDQIDFIPLDNKKSNRNKILAAKKFWYDNEGLEVVEETIYDMLITGIGYNWLGKISDKQLKEFCEDSLKSIAPELEGKELEFKAQRVFDYIKSENKEKLVKKLRHVASSTVSINSNEYEVTGYIQRVGVNIKMFDPEEILVFKLMPLDGKLYPYPPLEALLSEIYLLWLIDQNYVSFFENGGVPDNVFILPKEIAGSKNHQYLIDTLKKYKKIQNKHGNLVFTGDLSIEKLAEVESQMQHKDLGLYVISVLAMVYGIPVSRLPFLIGKAANLGDAGGLADSGYWRKISVWQSKIETVYNKNLFIPYFGVQMKFRRGYLQDEVRETATEMQKTQIVEQRLRLGLWTIEEAAKYLNIDYDEIREAQRQKKERDAEMMKSGMLYQNLSPMDKIIPEPDNQQKRDVKRNTQNNNQLNAGGKKINP